MMIHIGDKIRAAMGGSLYAYGTVHSFCGSKIRVQLPGGQVLETELRGDHTINGRKPADPRGAVTQLRALDSCEDLTEWEKEFVGDLLQSGDTRFSPKQEDMIARIYRRRL